MRRTASQEIIQQPLLINKYVNYQGKISAVWVIALE
jgi:hypothetical protein